MQTRHLWRSARRVTVLILVDLSCFWLMRAVLRVVRDDALLGETLARSFGHLLPRGALTGWQYAAALLLGLMVMGNYGPGDQRRDPRRLFLAAALATALPLWNSIWSLGLGPVVTQYVLTTLLVWLGLGAGRFAVQKVVARMFGVGHAPFRTLFVGPAARCREAVASEPFTNPAEYSVVGFADTDSDAAPDSLGPVSSVDELVHKHRAETVIICGTLSDPAFGDVVAAAFTSGCELLAIPRDPTMHGLEPKLAFRGGRPLIQLTEPRLRGWQLLLKRIVDVLGSFVALAVSAPVLGVVAVAIKLDSPGPVLFRQNRIGAGGRRFEVLKFRTMTHGAPDDAHRQYVQRLLREDSSARGNGDGEAPVFKLQNDSRVTRFGTWLRRTSLDELPQLINVLRGDMSLVGPRPPLPYEVEEYEYWQFERLGVKPGITGLWQVSGRNRLTYRQMCQLDARYVRTWSVFLDLRIMLRTLPVVLTNSGRAS